MRNFILAILLIGALVLPGMSSAKSKSTLLQGKCVPGISYLVLFRNQHYGIANISDTIWLSKRHTFSYSVKISGSELAFLSYNNKQFKLWLLPGKNLAIDLSEEKPVFSGGLAAYAQYYQDDEDLRLKALSDYRKRNPGFEQENNLYADRYFMIQDSISLDRISFLKRCFPDKNRTAYVGFVRLQTSELVYESLFFKLAYENPDLERFKFYQQKYHVNQQDAYLFSELPVFDKPGLLSSFYYEQFTVNLVMEMTQKRIKISKLKWTIDAYVDTAMRVIDELAAGASTATDLKAIVLNNLVLEIKMTRKMNYADKVKRTLKMLNVNHNICLQVLEEEIDHVINDTKFIKGKPAPEFTLRDTAGHTYTLKDFKGKKLYIDLNASWCGHCVEEIPDWNKLQMQYKNDDQVIFISLSVDDTEADWRKLIHKHATMGLNLYAGVGGFKGEFVHKYEIIGLPHFMVLDAEGKFVAYSAPRPGDPAIKLLLSPQP